MTLESVLAQVRQSAPDVEGYSVVVLKDYDRVQQDLPFEEFPIYNIDLEEEAREITLLTYEESETTVDKERLTANVLLSKLDQLRNVSMKMRHFHQIFSVPRHHSLIMAC